MLEKKERPLAGETAATLANLSKDQTYPSPVDKSNGDGRVPAVFVKDGKAFANSRDVAAFFGKRHDHVTRDIAALVAQEPSLVNGRAPNFGETLYEVPGPNGATRSERCFDMTRDGFTLLGMGFTGPQALKWKLRYIEAFNALEAQQQKAPAILDPAQFLPIAIEYASKLLEVGHRAEVAERKATEETARAEAAERTVAAAMADVRANARLSNAEGGMIPTDAANAMRVSRDDMIAFMCRCSSRWTYRQGRHGRLRPFRDKVKNGLLRVEPRKREGKNGKEIAYPQLVITPKGLVQLAKELEGAGMKPAPIYLVAAQQELDLKAESKLAISAPADPHKRHGRIPGSKNRWTIADVCEWLSSQLADGPRGGSELRRLAQEAGLNSSPLYRACKVLGVVREDRPGVTRNSQGGSPEKLWSLPQKEDPIQTKGDASPNIEEQGQGQPQIQNKQGKPGGWLSRFIGG